MRPEKQLLLDEVKEQISEYSDFAIFQYSGVSANKISDFRTEIAKLGGEVQMVRKRILIKAAAAAGVELDLATLPGHIGLVYSGEDAVEMTKAVFQFSKDTDKALQVLGGQLDGQLYNAADVETLSKLPGRDEMRAQLLGLFEAPMSQMVSVVNALLTSVPYCLENKCKEES
ncbi:MAG: 50S ribosomal protein L10 [Chlamydiota bacterium]|nr:50S ribosomal protein L10 [Chlamydiota bacterium]